MDPQNIDIRTEIVNNFEGSTKEHVEETIIDAIKSGDEKVLLGFGVLFELMWNQSSDQERQEFISLIHRGLQDNTSTH